MSTAASYKTALIPMSITETTNFAMMSEVRASRDRDWQDLRAIFQWKMRTRRFLLPFLENQEADASGPMSMFLSSIVRIVKGYPRDDMDLARQMNEKLPGLSLQDEARLSEQEWIKLSDDLERVIRLSDEEEWSAQAISTLRDLRIERFRLDNPEISEEDIISYFPVPITDHPEEEIQDSVLAKVARDSVVNSDQLPADIRASVKDLDGRNADMRSKLLAEVVVKKNFRNIPSSFRKRIQENPAFTLLSKQGSAEAGESEFDHSEQTLEMKARLVAESFYLRPPRDQETSMPAFGSTKTLYAMPRIAKAALDASFIATKGSMVIIEVSRMSSQVSLVGHSSFLSNLVFAFNLPQNRNPQAPDIPSPPSRNNQDDFSAADWDDWAEKAELTSLLARTEMDEDDAKDKWFSIFRLLRSYRITPILFFKSALDFTMFRFFLNLDNLSVNDKDITFAAIVTADWSEQAIAKWSQWLNNKTAFDYQRRSDQFAQLSEIISQSFSSGQSRYASVINVDRSTMTVSALPIDFSLNSLTYGPWAKEFQARRIWAPSPSDMVVAFNGQEPRVYPTVFFSSNVIPQALLDQVHDRRAVEAALDQLQNQDANAYDFLAYVWNQVTSEFGPTADETFRYFYHEVRMMIAPVPVHTTAPVPLSTTKPIPVFFREGERINNVITDSPTFVQSFAWKQHAFLGWFKMI